MNIQGKEKKFNSGIHYIIEGSGRYTIQSVCENVDFLEKKHLFPPSERDE